MPSDLMLKTMNTVHRTMLKISGGRLGWEAGKMPVLKLTTIGRKSGEPRTVMLTAPHKVGDTLVIVASKGGEDTHPAWFLNLRDHPEVQVETKGTPSRTMVARIATAAERDELWPVITKAYKNYGSYQAKTEREIPVVLLDPKP
jgi:deazaflavin-dependent oxidoreductase (nitroreductase family)